MLILKHHPDYKKVYSKQGFPDWDFAVQVLLDWKVISAEVADSFLELKKFRNDAIHYNDGYDFQINTKTAVVLMAKIVEKQFGYLERKDSSGCSMCLARFG